MRALDLERGIRKLLADPDGTGLATEIFGHPLIASLFLGEYQPGKLKDTHSTVGLGQQKHMPFFERRNLPSYIPATNFVQALLDRIARGAMPKASPPAPQAPFTASDIRTAITQIQNPAVERAVLSAFDAAKDDLDVARANLETWFNDAMDRVSGWYKRRTQLYLFLIGLVAAVALNLDAVNVTRHMIEDGKFRDLVVAEADAVVKAGTEVTPDFQKQRDQLAALDFPIGWSATQARGCFAWSGACWLGNLQLLLGWLITAFAVMLGAPFWFDLINKIVTLRGTGKEPAKDGKT